MCKNEVSGHCKFPPEHHTYEAKISIILLFEVEKKSFHLPLISFL